MKYFAFLLILLTVSIGGCKRADDPTIRIGSKAFTESVVLGDLMTQLARAGGSDAEHAAELGGSPVLWKALTNGEIDAYPEYTGTLMGDILSKHEIDTVEELEKVLSEYGVKMSAPLGFNNSYVLGMKEKKANELGIDTISDLAQHSGLEAGFSNEFMDREDGWPGLRATYGLTNLKAVGINHDLAYRALASGNIQVIDLYGTDSEIEEYNLRTLEDNLGYFPRYDAIILYREDVAQKFPQALKSMLRLQESITATEMIAMNSEAKIDGEDEAVVAAKFAAEKFKITSDVYTPSLPVRLYYATLGHLKLVGISLALGILIAIPLGIAAAHNEVLGQAVLAVVGVLQTIPSLVLLVLMIPFLGLQDPPTIAALFVYSLLPIVRNTHSGLTSISPSIKESAAAIGLPPVSRLWQIELPNAARSILAGIKTSAVINVGTATLGGLVGSGGYGQAIITGIRKDDMMTIAEGAIPAAIMALALQGLFELAERGVVPKGLRIKAAG